jgi:PEP-CTERM motif
MAMGALILLAAGARPVNASSITVPNFSFESPVLTSGEFVSGSFTDWTVGGFGGQFYPTSSNADLTPGTPAGNQGVTGNQVGVAGSASGSAGSLTQVIAGAVAGTTYQLDVNVGSRKEGIASDWSVELIAGTASSTLSGIVNPGTGTFSDQTVTVTAAGTGSLNFTIVLSDAGSFVQSQVGVIDTQTLFDNVRLQSLPSGVPEPATLTLLGIGAVGLLGYGLRRRKLVAA